MLPEAMVSTDKVGNGVWAGFKNAAALALLHNSSEDALIAVVQDDVVVCRNLGIAIQKSHSLLPAGAPILWFMGEAGEHPGRPELTTRFFHADCYAGPAVSLPGTMLKDFLKWEKSYFPQWYPRNLKERLWWEQGEDKLGDFAALTRHHPSDTVIKKALRNMDDWRLNLYCKLHGVVQWTFLPSLVDHLGWPSVKDPRSIAAERRSISFVGTDFDATALPWDKILMSSP